MEEEQHKSKWSKKAIALGVSVLIIVVYFAAYLPIRTNAVDKNCTKEAQAPYAAWQYQDIESLYNQQQPPTGLPFSPAEYRVVAYNSCVSSWNGWF